MILFHFAFTTPNLNSNSDKIKMLSESMFSSFGLPQYPKHLCLSLLEINYIHTMLATDRLAPLLLAVGAHRWETPNLPVQPSCFNCLLPFFHLSTPDRIYRKKNSFIKEVKPLSETTL